MIRTRGRRPLFFHVEDATMRWLKRSERRPVRRSDARCRLTPAIEALEQRLVLSTLLTDQPDYLPGTAVVFNGRGFAGNETIDLNIISIHSDGSANNDGGAALQVVAGDDGSFTAS